MRKANLLCIAIALVLLCLTASCNMQGGASHKSSEVDFSVSKRVQVSFNKIIYNIYITSANGITEIIVDDSSSLNGLKSTFKGEEYKIEYNNMTFKGDISTLSDSFLPKVIYNLLTHFSDGIMLNSYDDYKACYYTNVNINNYFITIEEYQNSSVKSYSIEIK